MTYHNKCYEDVSIAKGLSNKFYEYIFVAKGRSNKDMLKFSKTVRIQGPTVSVAEKKQFWWKKMTENINNTRSETEFASVEDPLNIPKTASNREPKTEILATSKKKNVLITPGQGKISVKFQMMNFMNRNYFLISFLRLNLAVKLIEIFQ